jgi:hypothetical protein
MWRCSLPIIISQLKLELTGTSNRLICSSRLTTIQKLIFPGLTSRPGVTWKSRHIESYENSRVWQSCTLLTEIMSPIYVTYRGPGALTYIWRVSYFICFMSCFTFMSCSIFMSYSTFMSVPLPCSSGFVRQSRGLILISRGDSTIFVSLGIIHSPTRIRVCSTGREKDRVAENRVVMLHSAFDV